MNDDWVLIVEVGAEGGTVRLAGRQDDTGAWEFRLATADIPGVNSGRRACNCSTDTRGRSSSQSTSVLSSGTRCSTQYGVDGPIGSGTGSGSRPGTTPW